MFQLFIIFKHYFYKHVNISQIGVMLIMYILFMSITKDW